MRVGTTLLQPTPAGQTDVGQLGTALQQGADTLSAQRNQQFTRERQSKQDELTRRQVESEELRTRVAEKQQIGEEVARRSETERRAAEETRKGLEGSALGALRRASANLAQARADRLAKGLPETPQQPAAAVQLRQAMAADIKAQAEADGNPISDAEARLKADQQIKSLGADRIATELLKAAQQGAALAADPATFMQDAVANAKRIAAELTGQAEPVAPGIGGAQPGDQVFDPMTGKFSPAQESLVQ